MKGRRRPECDEEILIVEDDRRRLPDGRIQVSGTFVARGGKEHYRSEHTRKRPQRR